MRVSRAIVIASTLAITCGLEAQAPAAAVSLVFDRVVQTSISVRGQVDEYTFPGTSDDVVEIRIAAAEYESICFELKDPAGITFTPQCGYLRFDTRFRVLQSGTYSLKVSVPSRALTQYAIVALCTGTCSNPPGPGIPARKTAEVIPFNNTVAGVLGTRDQVDLFTFPGSTDDEIELTIQDRAPEYAPSLCFDLRSSDGRSFAQACSYGSLTRSVRVLSAGIYTIRIQTARGELGAYSLRVNCKGACGSTPSTGYPSRSTPEPLRFGTAVNGVVGSAEQTDLFSFPGSTDDQIEIRLVERQPTTFNNMCLDLLDAQKNRVLSPACGYQTVTRQLRILSSGTHIVRVGAQGPVAYTLLVSCTGRCSSTPATPFPPRDAEHPELLTYGRSVIGAIGTPGRDDYFLIAGTADDEIEIRAQERAPQAGANVCFDLHDGKLSRLLNGCGYGGASGKIRLLTSEMFLVRVGTANNDLAAYTLTVTCSGKCLTKPGDPAPVRNSPEPLPYRQTVKGIISTPGQIDLFSLAVTAGDAIRVEVQDRAVQNAFTNWCFDVWAVDGLQADYGDCQYQGIGRDLSILRTGTMVLRVAAGGGATGSYSLSVQCSGTCSGTPQVPDSLQAKQGNFEFEVIEGSTATSSQGTELISTRQGVAFFVAPNTESWLSVSPTGGSLPASISIGVNALGLSPGEYKTTVTVEAAGVGRLNLPVLLRVTPPASEIFKVDGPPLQFAIKQGVQDEQTKLLQVKNVSREKVKISAAIKQGSSWAEVSQSQMEVEPGEQSNLAVRIKPNRLPGGLFHRDSVVLSASTQKLELAVLASVEAGGDPKPRWSAREGVTLYSVAGSNRHIDKRELLLMNEGGGDLSWLSSPSATTVQMAPTAGSFLKGGQWAAIEVSTDKVQDLTYQENGDPYPAKLEFFIEAERTDIPVKIRVLPSTTSVLPPRVRDAGVILNDSNRTTQPIRMESSSPSSAPFKITKSGWLRVSRAGSSATMDVSEGQLPAAGTLELTVGVATDSKPNFGDHGEIRVEFTNYYGDRRNHEVIIDVVYAGSAVSTGVTAEGAPKSAAACAPVQVSAVFTTPGKSFEAAAGYPVQLEALVSNNCGDLPEQGAALVTFSTDEPPVELKRWPDGRWRGTWVPYRAFTDPIQARLWYRTPEGLTTKATLNGMVTHGDDAPVILRNSVTNAASRQGTGNVVAPGEIIVVQGRGFAKEIHRSEEGALSLGSATVRLGKYQLRLFQAGPDSIHALVPTDIAVGQVLPLVAERDGKLSLPMEVRVVHANPGVFAMAETGSGQGAISGPSMELANSRNPVRRGDVVTIYATGLGRSEALEGRLRVLIGSRKAEVVKVELSSAMPGVVEVRVRVPDDVPGGDTLPVEIQLDGIASNAVTIAVR